MNWREKIEAQIAEIDTYTDCPDGHVFRRWRDTMQALLYVAVAADVVMHNYDDQTTSVIAWDALSSALDKLREVSDA